MLQLAQPTLLQRGSLPPMAAPRVPWPCNPSRQPHNQTLGARPCLACSVPTPLPRALSECGVSCVLSHLSFEDQQRLEEARAFLAAI